MTVTSPVVTITDIQRNSSSQTSGTDALANVWGALYNINSATGIHDEVLILHASDNGSGTWDTDTYLIEYTATNSGQTRGSWFITKSFEVTIPADDIPTQTTTWDSGNIETISFDSGDLDIDPDDHVQYITGVAILDDSEWESGQPDIFGVKVLTVDAMPKVMTASAPTSFAFVNDEFTFDSGDAGQTVSVTLAHENLDVGTPLYAELFNSGDVSETIYSTNPFSPILTNGYYLHLYIEMPYDGNYVDGSPVAVRRIDMTQNP